MAAQMKSWLGQTIEHEVKSAIQWRQARVELTSPKRTSARVAFDLTTVKVEPSAEAQPSQSNHSRQYSTDGSNLRVSCGGSPGKYVQVIEFTDSQPPYPAILSDGTSRIKAKFSSAAQDKFEKENGRPLSQATRGGVFLLFAFEIVLSLQTVQNQVTLLVKDCQFKGAAGSAAFGRSEHIDSNQAISTLLRQLRSLDRENSEVGDSKAHSERVRTASPFVVRRASSDNFMSMVNKSSTHATHARSNTTVSKQPTPEISLIGGTNVQSPRGPRKGPTHSRPATVAKDIENLIEINESSTINQRVNTGGVALGRNASPVEQITANRSHLDEKGTVTPNILAQRQNVGGGSSGNKEVAQIFHERMFTSKNGQFEESTAERISTTVVEEPPLNMSKNNLYPIYHINARHKYSIPPIEEGVLQMYNAKQLVPESDKPSEEPKNINTTESPNVSILVTPTGKSKHIVRDTKPPQNSKPSEKLPDDVSLGAHSPQSISHGQRFDSMKNIMTFPPQSWRHENNFKFVRFVDAAEPISDMQTKLLARPESWQHPLPGFKFPSPNVPISLLEALNNKAASLLNMNSVSSKGNQEGIDKRVEIDEDCMGYQSSEVSSTDWPLSPHNPPGAGIHTVLPPDSSAVKSSHSRDGDHHYLPLEVEYSGSAPFATASHTDSEIGRKASIDQIPDDDSDLEMEQPHALPAIHPHYAQSDRGPMTASYRDPPSPQPTSASRTWQRTSGIDASSSLSRSTIPHVDSTSGAVWAKNALGVTNISPSPEAIIPGTIQIDTEPCLARQSTGHLHNASNFKPPKTLSTTSFNQQIVGRAIAITQPDNTQPSTQSNDSPPPKLPFQHSPAKSSGLKRKQDAMLASSRSPNEVEKYLRCDLGLHEASQPVLDPALAARQARHAFMKNNVTNPVPTDNTHQHDRLKGNHQDVLQQVQEHDGGKGNSPSSYQPHQDGSKVLPKRVNITGPPAHPPVETYRLPRPQTSKQDSKNTDRLSSQNTAPTPGILPSLQSQASKASMSSSTNQANSFPKEHPTSSANEVYDMFKTAYPNYTGNIKHFSGLCRKIQAGGKLHRSLWDDFIVRHKMDYVTYISKCTEDGEETMPYEQYYNDRVEASAHNLRVMDPTTLAKVLANHQQPGLAGTLLQGSRPLQHSNSVSTAAATLLIPLAASPSLRQSSYNSAPRPLDISQSSGGARNAARPESRQPSYPNSSQLRLTGDDSPLVNRTTWPQGPQASPSGLGRLPPPGNQGTHTPTVNAQTPSQDVRTDADGLGIVVVSPNAGSPPPPPAGGQRVARGSSLRRQLVGEAHGTREVNSSSQNVWWQEDDTPFKEFVRNYARLRVHGGVLGVPGRDAVLEGEWEGARLNVLDWRF